MTPRVSVVTACFNDGRQLHLPIGAVIAQTLNDWEMIVVDDGSTDPDTLAILERISHPQIRVLRQANQRLPAARNAGIEVARGQYVLPLDADDRIVPHCLERFVETLDAQPTAAVAYSGHEVFGSHHHRYPVHAFDGFQLLCRNFIPVCSMFRRDAWRAVGGYYTGMHGAEDWEFWLNLFAHGFQFVSIAEPLVQIQSRSGSLIKRNRSRYRQFLRLIHRRHPDLFAPENMARLRRNHHITWAENLIYRTPPEVRCWLEWLPRAPTVGLLNRLGLYRHRPRQRTPA